MAFLDGDVVIGTAPLVEGVATWQTSILSVGTHSLVARYAGSAFHAGSTGQDSHMVERAQVQITIDDVPDTAMTDEAVKIETSLVPLPPGAGTPTGSVTVTATQSAGCSILVPTMSSCELMFSAPGLQQIDASYSGDGNFEAAMAPSISHQAIPSDRIFRDGFEQ